MYIFSNIVKPRCMSAAPEICVVTLFGLIALPQSTTLMSLVIFTWPVSVSTSTSAPEPASIQNGVTFVLWPVPGVGAM